MLISIKEDTYKKDTALHKNNRNNLLYFVR